MSQASFAKRQREKERKEKAEAKAARRAERQASTDEVAPAPPVDESALLAELAELHRRFDEGDIVFDDFAVAKERITQRLLGD